jgi:hypothetical protein
MKKALSLEPQALQLDLAVVHPARREKSSKSRSPKAAPEPHSLRASDCAPPSPGNRYVHEFGMQRQNNASRHAYPHPQQVAFEPQSESAWQVVRQNDWLPFLGSTSNKPLGPQ